ncbi:hydroxyneurosporene synthase CrtC-like protein [Leptospira interrogans serovar Zanoni str. LT2156]|uniref:Hydroxyneurosporene synthase CrtC-like protein n=1 Tax=Leptospira interrogans serovar Zanoni str. LT2156 TaxID=1001601 RepID=M6HDD8_LEPIR|nr:hydroxyneurosporene synthase CrtC-like protein [Leptospira interrogans serovar Zanoni str. LT2156]
MDHEWSTPFHSNLKTTLSHPSNSWDWVCIQLEDGSDIMAFNFRKTIHSNSESFGTIRFSSGKKFTLNKKAKFDSFLILPFGPVQEQTKNIHLCGIFPLMLLLKKIQSFIL